MRRRRLPLDQKGPELQDHVPADQKQGDLTGASGKSAGMPLFLNQAAATAVVDQEARGRR